MTTPVSDTTAVRAASIAATSSSSSSAADASTSKEPEVLPGAVKTNKPLQTADRFEPRNDAASWKLLPVLARGEHESAMEAPTPSRLDTNIAAGRCGTRVVHHNKVIRWALLSPDGQKLVTGIDHLHVRCGATGETLFKIHAPVALARLRKSVQPLAVRVGADALACVWSTGDLITYDLERGTILAAHRLPEPPAKDVVVALRSTRDGLYGVCTIGKKAHIWGEGNLWTVRASGAADVSPDGRQAFVPDDGELHVFDTKAGRTKTRFANLRARCVVHAPDDKALLCVSDTPLLVDPSNGALVAALPTLDAGTFLPHAGFAGAVGNTVHLWDTRGKVKGSFDIPPGVGKGIRSLQPFGNGAYLAVGFADASARVLMRTSTGELYLLPQLLSANKADMMTAPLGERVAERCVWEVRLYDYANVKVDAKQRLKTTYPRELLYRLHGNDGMASFLEKFELDSIEENFRRPAGDDDPDQTYMLRVIVRGKDSAKGNAAVEELRRMCKQHGLHLGKNQLLFEVSTDACVRSDERHGISSPQ